MEIQMGGGVFELGNPEGRGAQAVLEIQVGGGGQKNMPSVVGVWIFSGITHWTGDEMVSTGLRRVKIPCYVD